MTKPLLPFVLLSLLSLPAQAHLLKVFAYAAGERVEGNVYFAGGDPAGDANIRLLDARGASLAEARSDATGQFSLALASGGTSIQADTGDGHVAHWALSPQGASTPAEGQRSAASDLERQIESAVARQLAPLRLELQQHAARARLSDVLGGLGTLLGIAGALLWWRSRRPQP
ncbi:carboxypeptidase-like regulatory domain-containing protein [Aestuariirhabdus litorea]|uniref:Carboxypeptidase regulatory-like domain-containing protein n=1 Tax=Aestuariirhabdus litorea TaxID=2528527 RepID=A0A3P3VMC3_9GAMM|nr:carboxypeptidase-like regulatory domain-containing protein [Aestuariirhabdus litorea]RRJ83028.1 carboxypeptidase regulatory-like domain-containing protein [Aestuariirhabdus litorea]RWW93186.1 carboxypeptidase regulatory-like domain-containing protein [Endozoicomonadaceae bacterium GTF-13]